MLKLLVISVSRTDCRQCARRLQD